MNILSSEWYENMKLASFIATCWLRSGFRILIALFCMTGHAHAADRVDFKNALTNGQPHEREAASQGLLEQGPRALPVLVDVLKAGADNDAKLRADRLIRILLAKQANRDTGLLDNFGQLALSEDQTVSGAGINAIAAYKHNSKARKLLEDVFGHHKDEYSRGTALGALMVNTENDKQIVSFINKGLEDKSDFVQVQAAGYLGTLGDKRGLPICLAILERTPVDEKTRGLQMRAANSAGLIGDPSALPILRKIADSASHGPASWDSKIAIKDIELHGITARSERLAYLREALSNKLYAQWAANTLRSIGGTDAIAVLRAVAADASNPGRDEARIYLRAMGQKID